MDTIFDYKMGPLPVINGVINPRTIGVITPRLYSGRGPTLV